MDDDNEIYRPGDTMPDFHMIVGCLLNCLSHCNGLWSSTETRLFLKFFGTSKRDIELVWELIVRDEL